MEWLRQWKYVGLLAALLLFVVVCPVLRGSAESGRLLLDVLLTLFFVATYVLIFWDTHRAVAIALGVPALTSLWMGYALPDTPRTAALLGFHLIDAVFLGLCVKVILSEIHRARRVSFDHVCGALCGYLLIGLVFSHLYSLTQTLAPGSFLWGGKPLEDVTDSMQRYFVLAYFSLVTMTTLGYGDVVPVGDAARGLAVVEAMIGQFYLAVLIGELIGKRVAQAVEPRQPDGEP